MQETEGAFPATKQALVAAVAVPATIVRVSNMVQGHRKCFRECCRLVKIVRETDV
jgi:methylmalonyl-CoA mutase cobalamin-binding subunit